MMGSSSLSQLNSVVSCEPMFGFLPCTTKVWGSLFLIVIYQYLMTLGNQYISAGSDLFFRFTGPGILGASVFHILGTIPQMSLILVSGLAKEGEGAAREAGMGMSVLAGSAVMSLTLIWASCVAFGSFDLSDDDDSTSLAIKPKKKHVPFSLTGTGVRVDKETTYTARIMLVAMIPFIVLQLPKILNNANATRVTVIVALAITLFLFVGYIIFQVFQPWIQNRRFEYVTQKYVKNKLMRLLSSNGKPNKALIREIYKELDKNQNGSVSATELRILILGIQLEADGFLRSDYAGKLMGQFDLSGDGNIGEDEFVRVLSKWLVDARKSLSENDHNPLGIFSKRNQKNDQEQQQSLIPKKTSPAQKGTVWQYIQAFSLVLLGTAISAVIAQPLVMAVVQFAQATSIPGFLIPYFIIPCTLNLQRGLSLIRSVSEKTERAASLTLSQIYSGVFMSSMSSLTIFLLTLVIRDLTWDVSAEVLVVMLICTSMGIVTSVRDVFPIWTSFVSYLLYPISLLMLYVLTTVFGWS